MGILDGPLRGVASTLLQTFGQLATLRRETSSFSPATATATLTPTDYSVKVRAERYSAHEIDGTIVQPGDVKVLVPALGLAITPTPATDKLILGGVTHEVVRVNRIIATDQPAVYEVHARAGAAS